MQRTPKTWRRNNHKTRLCIRNIFFILFLLILLKFPVFAQDNLFSQNSASKGGVLIFSFVGEVPVLDPGTVKDRGGIQICSSIFEGLVKYDKSSFRIVPAIARKWHSQDNLIWTFYLNKGTKFHDGTVCDANSIKFNFDRQLNPSHPFSKPSYGSFSSMKSLFGVYGDHILKTEAPQDDKFRVILKTPDSLFLNKIAHISACIVSPSAVKKYGNLFCENPVGTGSYRFSEWRKPGRIILASNQNTFLDRAVFETYLDFDSCQRQLLRGNIDIAVDLPRKQAKSAGREIVYKTSKTFDQSILLFNCKNRDIKNRNIRKAISYLINKKELSLLFEGELSPSFIYSPLSNFAGEETFSPEKCEELLKSVPDFSNRTFNLIYPSQMSHIYAPQELAEKIVNYLKRGGIKVALKKLSPSDYYRALSLGEYDMALWVNTDISGDSAVNLSFLWSSRASKYGKNLSFYSNSSIDSLLQKAEFTDSASERLSNYRKIDSILISDMPSIPLFYCSQSLAYSRGISNINIHPSGILNISEIWLSR